MNKRTVKRSSVLISRATLVRLSLAIALAASAILPFFAVFSAPLSESVPLPEKASTLKPSDRLAGSDRMVTSKIKRVSPFLGLLSLAMPAPPVPESIATYDVDCLTPKQSFSVGDTACAKAEGTFIGTRTIYWVNSQGEAVETDTITEANPSATWVVSQSGNWKAYLSEPDGLRALAFFSGSDPLTPSVDLSVSNTALSTSSFVGDGIITYVVTVLNNGPDAAEEVALTQTLPNNATREAQVSVQDDGPLFSCTDYALDTVCTINSLASGTPATFTFIYKLNNGLAAGTLVSNNATIASVTSELHEADNTAATEATVIAGAAPSTCTLDCPGNITTVANTSFNGTPGAYVTFSSAEGIGSCGEISTSAPSGSFFPVDTTTVVVTSSIGGGACSFTITVVTEGAPTISCPPDQTVTAAANSSEATVDPGTPTTNPATGVSVSGVRSDANELNAPYPVGTTFIAWTVTDSSGLSSGCSQRIVVNSDACGTDTEDPTITAPTDVTVTTPPNTLGSCGYAVGESQLGSANAQDNCSVNVSRTGVPVGNFFPVGQTIITYTATDASGHSATDTQTVTVIDGSLPVIEAPADASYVCPSEVPAADPSQATRGDAFDDNGNLLPPGPPVDNCGTPTVSITESSAGNGSASSPMIITRVFTATDAAGNSASDTQTITVIDSVAPTVTAPADASYQCASEVPGADALQATASDNCSAPTVTVEQINNGGAGSIASPLVITRIYTAVDTAGNSANDSQIITVIDNTPPTIIAPASVSVGTGPGATTCTAFVDNALLGNATASDNCSVTFVRSGVPAGNVFPTGITTITYTATDGVGNIATATQTITVVDNTAPTISCLANIIADFDPAVGGATVNYATPVGADNCPGSVTTQIAGLPSGATFPVGNTTNTFRVTDAAGNPAECSFNVTVALTSILGLDSVSISGIGLVDSYNSTGGYPGTKGSLANVLSNGPITLGNSGKVFGNVRSTRAGVAMSGASQVTGDATAGTTVAITGSATVGGAITNNQLAPVMTLPSVPACGPAYSPNSGISGTYSYNPGTGDLTLSGVNVATLADGTYCFRNVTLTNSAQLKVNGSVVIKMTGTLNASGASKLSNLTGIPANLRILSSYSGSNGVILSNGTNAHAVIYAPRTGVTISGAAPLFGTVAGKTITISNSGAIHYDTVLQSIWPDLWMLIGP